MEITQIKNITYFGEQLEKVTIFLERPSVQIQLLALLLSWIIGFFALHILQHWFRVKHNLYQQELLKLSAINLKSYLKVFLLSISFHLWNIFTVLFLILIWHQKDLPLAFLILALQLYLIYFIYKSLVLLLLLFLPSQEVKNYEYSFFLPLLLLFYSIQIINLVSNVSILANIEVLRLFGSPITLGAIFLSTFGLYWWCITVNILQQISFKILALYNHLDQNSTRATIIISRYFLMGLGIVVIFGYIGFNPTAFAAITGGLSVGIGFGLKEVFSNFISGIILLFEGSLKPGDLIDVEGKLGVVQNFNMRATTVRILGDNSEKIIPNQIFFTTNVTTYTGSDRLMRYSLSIGVSYDCTPQKVIEILLDIAQQNPQVLTKPKPTVFLTEFADSAIIYTLNFSLSDPTIRLGVKSDLGSEIWQRFRAEGLEIPFPQQDVHLIER